MSTAEAVIEMSEPQELKQFEAETTDLVQGANVVVDSPEAYEIAGEMLLEIDSEIKKREEFMTPLKQAAHRAWKGLCDRENELLEPFRKARKILKDRMSVFATEQDRIRREEEARKAEEAKRLEEEEKKRLEEAARQASESGETEVAELFAAQAESVIVSPQPVEPVVQKTTRLSGGTITGTAEQEITVVNLREFLTAMLATDGFPIPEEEIKKAIAGKLKKWVTLHNVQSFPGLTIRRVINPRARRM